MQKIMFNETYGLQRAAIDGTKPMTRRAVQDKLQNQLTWIFEDCNYDYSKFWLHPTVQLITNEKAQYKVGEVVAIAQSYKDAGYTKEWVVQHVKPNPKVKPTDPFEKKYPGWNNKMFVKAEFMPNFIQFTANKIERLRDISDKDCMREGVLRLAGTSLYHYDESIVRKGRNLYHTPREAFASLIDKVSGRGTWDRNPWGYAYTFEILKKGGEK